MTLAGKAIVAAELFGALGDAAVGFAGAHLPGALTAGLISSVLLRKKTEAMAATRTSAEPISPIRIGVQKRLGCGLRLRERLLMTFPLSSSTPRKTMIETGDALLQPLIQAGYR